VIVTNAAASSSDATGTADTDAPAVADDDDDDEAAVSIVAGRATNSPWAESSAYVCNRTSLRIRCKHYMLGSTPYEREVERERCHLRGAARTQQATSNKQQRRRTEQ